MSYSSNTAKINQPNFDYIERRYDFLNHLLSFGIDFKWRKIMWNEFEGQSKGLILDLASGTGDSAKGLLSRGFTVVGLDLSKRMLQRAINKLNNTNYIAVSGTAYSIPFMDSSFDGVTCAFGIRNMHHTKLALKEINRVLKNQSKAVFLEFSMPKGAILPIYRFYLKYILPNIASLFSSKDAYLYLSESIERFYPREAFCKLLLESGFESCYYKSLTFGTVTLYTATKERERA